MPQAPVRLVTLLSSALYETYEYIARYLGERLDLSTSLHTGHELAEFARGEAEIGFLCGLLYVHLKRDPSCPVELLVAPVLQGERYQDSPLYFSDVIVRRDSLCASFEDLRGCSWAYNERASHSGYNLVCYSLLQRGLTLDYFRQTVETGSHLQSLRAVLDGKADATALDSHLLDVLFQQQPELNDELRVVDMVGPSPIPPLVIAQSLPPSLKQSIRETLLTMHHDPQAAHELSKGQIKRFAPVSDEDYNPIRVMFDKVQNNTLAV
ncbi:MAG TPA: PhnD/SsuA/transferrin family substrate-binding protein [Ktedonobacteraceae bacterium]|jgi:phosphonate transport system substrate-binding protein